MKHPFPPNAPSILFTSFLNMHFVTHKDSCLSILRILHEQIMEEMTFTSEPKRPNLRKHKKIITIEQFRGKG